MDFNRLTFGHDTSSTAVFYVLQNELSRKYTHLTIFVICFIVISNASDLSSGDMFLLGASITCSVIFLLKNDSFIA